MLLKHKANVNLCNKSGSSPLYKACQQGHDNTIKILLSNGAEINLCRLDGCSPLHVACSNGHKSSVELLLKYNADVKLCDKEGYTAYDYACQMGHTSIKDILPKNDHSIKSFFVEDKTSGSKDRRRHSVVQVILNDGVEIHVQYSSQLQAKSF